ncbi:MAG: hypothetical protein ABSH38_09750 [Verrucomicrobiota bacterium]|jgi:hypothetical protein
MKWKLFICGMVLIAAGCASNQNQYTALNEHGFTFDFSPAPTPGRTPMEMGRDYGSPFVPPVIGGDVAREAPPFYVGAVASPSLMIASSNP